MLNAPACKNLTLPIVLNPPLPGRFVGRIQYAPTRDNRKRKMNNEKIRYPAKLAGIPDDPFQGREIWQASLMP